jgi:hypothetical protein
MVPLIGALFNDVISSTYRIASSGSPNWRDVQRRGRDVTKGAVLVFAWRHDENSQDSRSTGQDTKPRPPENKKQSTCKQRTVFSRKKQEKMGGKQRKSDFCFSMCDGALFSEYCAKFRRILCVNV